MTVINVRLALTTHQNNKQRILVCRVASCAYVQTCVRIYLFIAQLFFASQKKFGTLASCAHVAYCNQMAHCTFEHENRREGTRSNSVWNRFSIRISAQFRIFNEKVAKLADYWARKWCASNLKRYLVKVCVGRCDKFLGIILALFSLPVYIFRGAFLKMFTLLRLTAARSVAQAKDINHCIFCINIYK